MVMAMLACAKSSLVCNRPLTSMGTLWRPNSIYTWNCNNNPYATRMWYHLENPDGFRISVKLLDGANDCASLTYDSLNGKPEVSYTNLGLTNTTMFDGRCNQVPCCLKMLCLQGNSGNCTNVKLSYQFSNDLNDGTIGTIADITTESLPSANEE